MGLALMEIVQGPAADKIVVVETVIVVLEMVVEDEEVRKELWNGQALGSHYRVGMVESKSGNRRRSN